MKAPALTHRQPSNARSDRFVVLPENRVALRAIRRMLALELAAGPHRRSFPLLFLHGPPGTGKSHLVSRLVARMIARSPGCSARIVAARDLGRWLVEGAAREFRESDLLVVEDVQHLSAEAAAALASLIDHRLARSSSVIVTAAAGPATLGLPARLTSRLAAGLVAGLEPLSSASRRRLARVLCDRRGLYVTDEVLDWLARRPGGGARPILGDVARLEQLARVHAPPLEIGVVTDQLPEDGNDEAAPVERLAGRVADHFGVKLKQLKGRERRRSVLWPRQVGMYLARRLTDLPLTRIGSFFGGCDHSTVLHACRKVEDALKTDPGLACALRQLSSQLT